MTVVITSSHSSTMSRPSTPPAAASVVDEGTSGMSTAGVSFGAFKPAFLSPVKRPCFPPPSDRETISAYPQATNTTMEANFKEKHLRPAPHCDITTDLKNAIDEIKKAGTCEVKTYKPCGQLLTHFSKTFYSTGLPRSRPHHHSTLTTV